jgi:exodeoxyribonuclease V gamma subunit
VSVTPRPGLTLHTSNRLERLANRLAKVISDPLSSPLLPEIVVVQSNGMRRWLEQQIAERHGICSNIRFPFPQKFFQDLLQSVFPEAAATQLFDREVMTWRIMEQLPRFASRPEFVTIANYIRNDNRGLRAYELAQRIAHVFDEYVIFRPKMILDWDAGAENDWQSILWRELSCAAPRQHQAALGLQLIDALKRGDAPVLERVSVFGISTLPPFYVSLIGELSARCPVHLFVMEPTPAWWGDVRSKREKARAKQPELFGFNEEETGDNELLAANGKLARDFLNLVADLTPTAEQEDFIPPTDQPSSPSSILQEIQKDIFELKSASELSTASLRPDGRLPEERRPVASNDRSLQIHSCHSAVRELEVLHDQLLDLFQNDSELKPKDIVVMMPDVSIYAPFIDAVFGVPENPKHKIPYSIADREVRAGSGIIDTFFRILEVLPGRFAASEVLGILESSPVQRCFQIAPQEVETIRTWIDDCAIRWGIDAQHRARLGLPAFAENSWRHGLDRMLLGYALRPEKRELFEGILPFDEIEGSGAELLGKFIEFLERLFSRAVEFIRPRSLSEWQRDLRETIDAFFAADDTAQLELNRLRNAISNLGEIARASQNDQAVGLDVAAAQLEDSLEESSSGAGFLSGQLTFCALKPMRSIPFKVVCLLGLDDGAYPRHDRPPSFDLAAQHPQRGDRNIRDSDRGLFLEELLSARQVFYLSYVGQSLRDNQPLPPSVVVSELLDYISENFETKIDDFVVRHPLQAFSPRNFQPNGKVFSYSAVNCAAGIVSEKSRREAPPFFNQPLSEPEEKWREVEITQLVEFFSHPSKFFVRNRLGIELPREEEELEDREPFDLHSLDGYVIEQRLLDDALDGVEPKSAFEMVRASGVLPAAGMGALIFDELCTKVSNFAEAIREQVAVKVQPAVTVRADLDNFVLNGRIDRIRGGTLLHYRLAKLKAKDFVRIWIEHLVRNLSEQKPALIFGKEGDEIAGYEFPPISRAREILRELLGLYWRGLREPLRLFPRTSWKFVEKISAGTKKESAYFSARTEWEGKRNDPNSRGEEKDSYIQLAFRNTAGVLDEEWEKISVLVLKPIFSSRQRR